MRAVIGALIFLVFSLLNVVLESFYTRKPLSVSYIDTEYLYEGLEGQYYAKENMILTDSLGSRAFLRRGQKYRGAILGGSTTVAQEVNQSDQISYKIAEKLGDFHVENHSLQSYFCQNIENRLSRFIGDYQFIAISSRCLSSEVYELERGELQKSSVEMSLKSVLIAVWSRVQYRFEKFLNSVSDWSDLFYMDYVAPTTQSEKRLVSRGQVPDVLPEPTENISDVQMRWVRNLGKVKFVRDVKDYSESRVKDIKGVARSMFKVAKKKSKNVFYITRTVAYSENENEGVKKKWKVLVRSSDGSGFLDNYSYAHRIRFENKIVSEVAESMGVRVIDLDTHMKHYLDKSDQYFFDHVHLTEKGIDIASKYIADQMAEKLE